MTEGIINPEGAPEEAVSEGLRWLRLIDREDYKDQQTGYAIDGEPVLVENFHLLCDAHARPLFVVLEKIGPDHPKFEAYRTVAAKMFDKYFLPQEAE